MSLRKSSAGPPPYTITCEPQPQVHNPAVHEDAVPSSVPPAIGWNTYQPPPPYPQPVPVHGEPTFTYPAGTTASVAYVAHQQPHVVITNMGLPKQPTHLTCPSCHSVINTRVEHKTNTTTHIWAACIGFWGLFFCLCCLGLIPYCCSCCKKSEHYCSECGAYIGGSS